MKMDWEREENAGVATLLRKAWLYGKMSDDLRAQAMQLKYLAKLNVAAKSGN